MAKTRVNNDEDEVMVITEPTMENPTDKDPEEGETTAAVVTTDKKKYVKVRTKEDIDCIIANKPYSYPKDKEVSVPSDVAAILCFANKAYRL